VSRWTDKDRSPLATLRAGAGYSIETAAVALEITARTLGRYENAYTDVPSRLLGKMAALYRVSRNDVLTAVDGTWEEKAAEAERKARDADLIQRAIAETAKAVSQAE